MKTPVVHDTAKLACQPVAPIFLRYRDNLVRYIRSKVVDPISQEDLLSEVMMKLYDQCEQLDTVKNVEAWLIGMARNTINDYFRSMEKRRTGEILAEVPVTETEIDEGIDIESCVHALMGLLPEKYRGPLEDYELKGIPQKDLAKVYRISISGIKSRVQRGRVMLKELFTAYCSEAVALSCQCESKPACGVG